MSARVIDGKGFAAKLVEGLRGEISALKAQGVTPKLSVVLVGDDPASQVYVRNKGTMAESVGMASDTILLPADTSQSELLAVVEGLNRDKAVHGILVQLPLPKPLDETLVINSIDPDKDVDGFHVANVGRLATGQESLVPCTPQGCLLLLKDVLGDDFSGKHAVVIGKSNIVGKPMALLLLGEGCTVTVVHSKTADVAAEVRRADILVAAAGRPGLVKADWLKPGATVIDVGINRITDAAGKSRLVGDVDYAPALEVAGAITPVPGGVGPMTIACLLKNTVQAAGQGR